MVLTAVGSGDSLLGFAAVASTVKDDFASTSWAVASLVLGGQGRFMVYFVKLQGCQSL
jgi:hypothetical protein